jgi:hypothetical protein
MNSDSYSLDAINVASPCEASWDGMHGDDRVRFCSQCQLNVYNISEMTREDAKSLIEQHAGRLCVRFYRRKDGTLITRDCPVGLRAVRRRLMVMAASVAALTISLVSVVTFGRMRMDRMLPAKPPAGPLVKFNRWVHPPPVPEDIEPLMGDVIVLPAPPVPPPRPQ